MVSRIGKLSARPCANIVLQGTRPSNRMWIPAVLMIPCAMLVRVSSIFTPSGFNNLHCLKQYPKKPIKFFAITHDILGDVFWDVFRKGLMDAAARYEVEVEHLRPGRFSPEIQASLIDAAIEANPDGIISTIPD